MRTTPWAIAPRVAPPVGPESLTRKASSGSSMASPRRLTVIDLFAVLPLAQVRVPDFVV